MTIILLCIEISISHTHRPICSQAVRLGTIDERVLRPALVRQLPRGASIVVGGRLPQDAFSIVWFSIIASIRILGNVAVRSMLRSI